MTDTADGEGLLRCELRTPRLVLREIGDDDVADVVAFRERNRAHLAPWEDTGDSDYVTASSVRRTILWARAERTSGTAIRFLARLAGETTICATINMFQITRHRMQSATIGYSVDVNHEGRGIMRETAEAVVAYAFEDLGLHRVAANYQPQNLRSGALLRRLGFTVEGFARDYLFMNGAWRDHILTARYNPDWRLPTL